MHRSRTHGSAADRNGSGVDAVPVACRAGHRYSLHNPAFVRYVVAKQPMQRGAIVPDNEVVGLPLVFVDEVVNRKLGFDLCEPMAALIGVAPHYVRGMATHVQRLAVVEIGADPRVLDRWILRAFVVAHRLHAARVVRSRKLITVHESQLGNLGPVLGRQQAQGLAHVGELGLTAPGRDLFGIEHRAECRYSTERTVGMPPLGTAKEDCLWFVELHQCSVGAHVGQVEDLWVVGMALVGLRQYLEFAECLAKLHQLCWGEFIATKHQDGVFE